MKPPLATLGLLALVLAGAWRWQLEPWLAARAAREQPELAATVDTLAVALDVEPLARTRPILLRWRFDPACEQVYELRIDESFAHEGVARFLGRDEEHSHHRLTLAPDPRRPARWLATLEPLAGQGEPRTRELHLAADLRSLGPRAPDLACRNRSWDLLEDALALGWPRLPASPLRPGEQWTGDSVSARCHETVCLDEAGTFDHARACQAMPWHETLAGFAHDSTHDTDPSTITLLRSRWHDDHEDSRVGITATRELALAEGRLLLARAEIDHRWSGVIRQLELRRVDACPLAR